MVVVSWGWSSCEWEAGTDDLRRSFPTSFCDYDREVPSVAKEEGQAPPESDVQPVAAVMLRIDQDHPSKVPVTFHRL